MNIGEAAHIYGAKDGAARFRADMTDAARAEITNGIWLCRNCHKVVDSDPQRFPAALLFQWRAAHERYVTSKLGTKGDLIKLDVEFREVAKLREDSPLAGQIVQDKPCEWECRLTAELLKTYLRSPLRKWNDLQRGLYSKATTAVDSQSALAWFSARLHEASRLASAMAALYTQELERAWGRPGEPGDPMEIRHVCGLIQSAADEILNWEERVRFVSVAEPYTRLFGLLSGALGFLLDKFGSIPSSLDEAVDWAEANPGVKREFNFHFVCKLPEGWLEKVQNEQEAIARHFRQ